MRPRIHPAAGALIRGVRALAGGGSIVVEEAYSAPWASLTLDGARHRVALRFAGHAAAARVAERLTSHEFGLAGHVVIDLGEVGVEGAVLRFAALTVEG